jgi:hypothetical protein
MKSTEPTVAVVAASWSSRPSIASTMAGSSSATRRGVNTRDINERIRPCSGGFARRIDFRIDASAVEGSVSDAAASPNPGLRRTSLTASYPQTTTESAASRATGPKVCSSA